MDRLYDRGERTPFFSELVFDTHGDLRKDDALNDAFDFELAQAVTENAIG